MHHLCSKGSQAGLVGTEMTLFSGPNLGLGGQEVAAHRLVVVGLHLALAVIPVLEQEVEVEAHHWVQEEVVERPNSLLQQSYPPDEQFTHLPVPFAAHSSRAAPPQTFYHSRAAASLPHTDPAAPARLHLCKRDPQRDVFCTRLCR